MANGKWMNRETVKVRTLGNEIEVYVPENEGSWTASGPTAARQTAGARTRRLVIRGGQVVEESVANWGEF